MNEQQLIDILWRFVGWSFAAVVALVSAIYGSLVWSQRKLASRVDQCATKEEVQKLESDLKEELKQHREDRMRRDDKVDEALSEIKEAVTGTHKRVDDLYRAWMTQSSQR